MEDILKQNGKSYSKLNTTGMIVAGITGSVAIGIMAVSLPFVTPALRRVCLPYVPATTTQVQNVLTALSGRQGRLLDLGSGDGRIVIAAARAGFKADGVELNPWLVLYSKFSAYNAGVSHLTAFYRKNLFNYSLRPYDNIIIFGVKEMMLEIEAKLEHEVEQETCVVACRFPLPNKQPSFTVDSGIDCVWVYKYKTKV